jgi:small GTP-binding protein
MGNLLRRMIDAWFVGPRDTQILLLGLDNAGKTSILYRLKIGEVVTTVPTTGFNVDTLEYKSLRFTVWDIAGQRKFRPLWRHYFEDSDAVIFVVDSCDSDERIEEATDELHSMLEEPELRGCPLLVFANKQDMHQSRTRDDMMTRMRFGELRHDRSCRLEPSSVVTCQGIHEGLNWLADQIKYNHEHPPLALSPSLSRRPNADGGTATTATSIASSSSTSNSAEASSSSTR